MSRAWGVLHVALLAAFVCAPAVAQAHPSHCGQRVYLTARADGLEVELDLSPGSLVARDFAAGLDADHDRALSRREVDAYGARALADLSLALDGTPLRLRLAEVFAPSVDVIETGEASVRLRATAEWPLGLSGRHRVRFVNAHHPTTSEYTVNAFAQGEGVSLARIERDATGATLSAEITRTVPNARPVAGGTLAAAPPAKPLRALLAAFAVGLLGFAARIPRRR
jgi:hypothetical protein